MFLIDKPNTRLTSSSCFLGHRRFNQGLPRVFRKNTWLVFFLLTNLNTAHGQVAKIQGIPTSEKYETLKISLQKNRLSIEAKQVPWQQLLTLLEEKTQIPIKSAKAINSNVTVSITTLPVTEALRQLFNHRFDSVFEFSDQKTSGIEIPKSVWLLSNTKNDTQSDNLDIAKTNDRSRLKAKPDNTAVGDAPAIENFDVLSIQELLDKARNEDNPELRIQALASLIGRHEQGDKSTEKLALETALDDKEASVRQYALQALTSQGGQTATEYLREALNDPDASVRMLAVESITLEGLGIDLLKDALSNPDKLVQTMAEERLKQVNQ